MPDEKPINLAGDEVHAPETGTGAGSRPDSASGKQSFLPERFESLGELGKGGMGVVYKAKNRFTHAIVAIKLISAGTADRSDAERFKREAQAASAFKHPNAVSVLDFGIHNETPYLVMEYLSGIGLDRYLAQQRTLDDPTTVAIAMDVCNVLAEAHKAGVVHRDLKPSNIMLETGAHGGFSAKVLDFGLAKITNLNYSQQLTQSGDVIGTPLYMSPEQFTGQQTDARSDIYSLGAVMYQCLTGRPPHEGQTPYSTMYKCLNEKPAPFSSFGKTSHLEKVVGKCLEVDTADRYQNAEELLADLEKVAQGKAIKLARRRLKLRSKYSVSPILAATAALIVVGCGALAGLFLNQHEDLTPNRPEKVNGKTIDDLNQQIEKHPDRAMAYFDRGVFHFRRDERANAIDDFSSAIELDPKMARAYLYRSEVYARLAQLDKALADSDTVVSLAPKWVNAYTQRSRVKYLAEQYHESLDDASKALSLRVWPAALTYMALSYDALGDKSKALSCMNRAVQTTQSWPDTYEGKNNDLYYSYVNRALVYLHSHQLDAVQRDLDVAHAIHKQEPTLWDYQAQAYASQNRMQEAQYAVERAVAFDLFPARGHRFKGEMWRAAGKWRQAAEEYSTSTSLEPWFGPAFVERAIAEIALGQLRSAELDLKKATHLPPASALANSYLAFVEDQLGDSTSAQSYMKTAVSLTPDLPMVLVNRARIHLNHGELAKAIEDCNRAIDLDHYLPDAYSTRAVALRQAGYAAEAAEDMKTATQLGWHDFEFKIDKTASANPASIKINRPDISTLKPDSSLAFPTHQKETSQPPP